MKLIVHDAKNRSRKASFALARMARLLVEKRNTGTLVRKRSDQWQNLCLQLNHHKIAAVVARHNKRGHKRTSHLKITEKFELLTACLIAKKKQDRSKRILKKWSSIVMKIMSINNFS